MDTDYELRGDPDAPYTPTKSDVRAQKQAEAIRDAAKRSHFHFHQITRGESVGCYSSHSHELDDPGHVHPARRVFPARADGGYGEETGPSLGTDPPPPVAANLVRVLEMVASWPPTPDHQLMRWRLRLFCGHVAERTAHVESKTVHAAFMGSCICPECGLDPATIVAARPLGAAGSPPRTPAPPKPTPADIRTLEKQLTRAQAEVARLEAEIGSLRVRH
jgi:hypothetical protein